MTHWTSLPNALEKCFPEVDFTDTQGSFIHSHLIGLALTTSIGGKRSKKKGYWLDIANRREFFLNFAAEKGFDPYRPENWANVTVAQVAVRKVGFPPLSAAIHAHGEGVQGRGLLAQFNGSLQLALKNTLTEIPFA